MNKEILKNDFYEAVNDSWLKKAKIPNDKSSVGAFLEIFLKNEKLLKTMTKELVEKNENQKLENKILINYVELYKLLSDFKTRNELKGTILKQELQAIMNLNTIDDFIENYNEFVLKDFTVPFNFSVGQDFKNTEVQFLEFYGPELILPEKSYYDDKHPLKDELLKTFKEMSIKLLSRGYFSKKEAKKIVEQALEFDQQLVEFSLSAQQKNDYVGLYNPKMISDLNEYSKNIDFKKLAQGLVNKEVTKINDIYPHFSQNIDKLVNDKNLNIIKSWMYLMTLLHYAIYTDDKSRVISGEYERKQSGIAKPMNKNKHALHVAYSLFKMPVGLYYAQKYFGNDAKLDVLNKVKNMINVYENRLKNNNWLSEATKTKAIIKLKSLSVHIGFPNQIRPYYSKIEIQKDEQGGNLIENIINIAKIKNQFMFSTYMEPVNKEYWSMSPMEVNAYYNPLLNQIVFPAGILNKPFYSMSQSSSQNYGGIGAVIAHEISHAFDNNGANFDENGNLNSWWTPEDYKKFEQLGQDMVELFDGVDTEFGKCNGRLTVSENIADAGGISCALEASMKEPNHNSKQFFKHWAIIWRSKYKEGRAKTLLATDPHAPTKLRANQQVKNLDEFYKAFKIKKGDKMYLEPEKRVKIW
ncbi:M13-type metalloendopeptidase [Mycoplasmopsis lipofaciens]|uniref:M13-type metalloendopeptidase n=1 Tax=Mycoplasmopsis lipofaciens TaxID=114884 RepID=UPI00048127B4|nr:M13 family metallopeptidase [Mycoplasmopsis lipofaciens]